MAVKRYAGDRFACLSTDTKPVNVVEGAVLDELDTSKRFIYVGSSWVSVDYLSNKTDQWWQTEDGVNRFYFGNEPLNYKDWAFNVELGSRFQFFVGATNPSTDSPIISFDGFNCTITSTVLQVENIYGDGANINNVNALTLNGLSSSALTQKAVNELISGNWSFQGKNEISWDQGGNLGYEVSSNNVQFWPFMGAAELSGTGAIEITLPTYSTADMIQGWIDVFQYSGEQFSLFIKVYTSSTWANPEVTFVGPSTMAMPTVRFGNQGGTVHKIWIGELSSYWSFPHVTARDWMTGYSSEFTKWQNGFTFAIEGTSFDTVSKTVTPTGCRPDIRTTSTAFTSATISDSTEANFTTICADSNSAQAYTLGDAPAGFQAAVIKHGTGDVNFSAGTGQSIVSKAGSTPSITAQYGAATLIKRTSTEWTVIGDIE